MNHTTNLKKLVMLTLILSLSTTTTAWFDEHAGNIILWTHRIPLTLTETEGIRRTNEPITIHISELYAQTNPNLTNTFNKDSIRITDPLQNEEEIPFQHDTTKNELFLYANVSPKTTKTLHIYLSNNSEITSKKDETNTQLALTKDGENYVVENKYAKWSGFDIGYFALFGLKKKGLEESILYPGAGLETGYFVVSEDKVYENPRYARNWQCSTIIEGPLRTQLECRMNEPNYILVKTLTFYSEKEYVDITNTIINRGNLTTKKWVIYQMLNPELSLNTTTRRHVSADSSYFLLSAQLDTEPDNHVYAFLGKNKKNSQINISEQLTLISTAITSIMGEESEGTARHMLIKGDHNTTLKEYDTFRKPLEKRTYNAQSTSFKITTPKDNTRLDLSKNEKQITIEVTTKPTGELAEIECQLIDPLNVNHSSVKLQKLSARRGEVEDQWLTQKPHEIDSKQTGVWNLTCTGKPVTGWTTFTDNKLLYLLEKGTTRKLDITRLYCNQEEEIENMEFTAAEGEHLAIPVCIANEGLLEEKNIRFTIESGEKGWVITENQEIKKLSPRSSKQISLELEVPRDVGYGEYDITVKALSDAFESQGASIRVTVVRQKFKVSVQVLEDIIQVKVEDRLGRPVSQAEVTLDSDDGKQKRNTSTQGTTAFDLGKGGRIDIIVKKQGYLESKTSHSFQKQEIWTEKYGLTLIVITALVAAPLLTTSVLKRSKEQKTFQEKKKPKRRKVHIVARRHDEDAPDTGDNTP